MASLVLISCETSTRYVNTAPNVRIGNLPNSVKSAGGYVKLPEHDINVSTPEGKAETEKLIVDLAASDRKNAKAVKDAVLFNKKQQSIYNKTPTKKSTLQSKFKGV